jgi:hypothetical protein
MQISRGRGASRQNERLQRRKGGVEIVDLLFDPGDLRVGDGQPRAARPLFREAEIGLDVEQVVLDARQRAVERRVGGAMQPDQADGRIDLIQGSVGGDAQVVFLAPLAAAERSGAVVAGAGVDAVARGNRRLWDSGKVYPIRVPRGTGFAEPPPSPGGGLAPREPDRRHDDDDGDELQQHAPAHQILRCVGRAAAHHVNKAEQQHDGDGADREGNDVV